MTKSCWGCGGDWKERWASAEVGTFGTKVSDGAETVTLCPDCAEELMDPDDGLVTI